VTAIIASAAGAVQGKAYRQEVSRGPGTVLSVEIKPICQVRQAGGVNQGRQAASISPALTR